MKKIILLPIIALMLWGCVTFSQSYKLGYEAALNKDWDKAIKYFEKAAAEDPDNSVYRLELQRAKILASYVHVLEARNLAMQGKKEEAIEEYKKAISYDPSNRAVVEEAKRVMGEEVKEEEPEEIRMEPPVRLKVRDEKINLKFPVDAPLRSIFLALGRIAGINIIFDEQFRNNPFSIDLADMTFEQALRSLCLASNNFYRVIDEKTVIVATDQPQKRVQYELNAIKTFYLSNIKAETIRVPLGQIIRTQFKQPNIVVDKNLNSVTLRDTPAVIELAEKVIRVWDKAKGAVYIDLEIMEVSRVKLKKLGLDLEQYLTGLRYSGSETSGSTGWIGLKGLDFSKSENFQITLPSAFLQFLESDADTKIIAQSRLRGVENEKIVYVVGEEVPFIRSEFSPIAAGGISQQPIVNYEYKNVGIDVNITPKIHTEKEVTLELEIKIKSLAGTGIANLPIITTREVKNVIRLKDGETNLLAGLLKDEERVTAKGIAGLKNIPLLGSLFSSIDQEIQQTDVILTITPYVIRTIPLSKKDREPLWVDSISTAGRTSQALPEDEFYRRQRRREAEREEQERRAASRQNLVSLSPPNLEVTQSREFRVSLSIQAREEVGNMALSIGFNPEVLTLKNVVKRGLLTQKGREIPFLKNIDNSSGICTIGFSGPEMGQGIKGSGSIVTFMFEAKAKGESVLSISNLNVNSPTGQALSFNVRDSRVVVR